MKVDRRSFLAAGAASLAAAGQADAVGQERFALSSEADPLGIRSQFPAATTGTYLNSPYIAPPPLAVEQAGIDFVRQKTRAPVSLGSMLDKGNEVRAQFATLFGAKPEEIGFLFATSEGENIVAEGCHLEPGDNVVVDDLHYETTYLLYKTLEAKKGIEVRVARSEEGRADAHHFEPLVDDKTRIVSVSWVSHQNGFRHDLQALSELAHAHDAFLYADGIQALGMFDTDLHAEGVDFVTSGTYKWLLGAYGVAPFFIREQHLDAFPPDRMGSLSIRNTLSDYEFELYDTARKFEYATLAFGPLYQLGAALSFLSEVGLARIEAHTVALARYLREGLLEQGRQVRTPADNGSSIVSFYHGANPDEARALFEREDVQVSFREEGRAIRAGAALFNNRSDIDRLLDVMKRLSAG